MKTLLKIKWNNGTQESYYILDRRPTLEEALERYKMGLEEHNRDRVMKQISSAEIVTHMIGEI